MNRIAESELILNSRGAIYHLDLTPDELSTNIITVGDPERVGEVSKHFDHIEIKRAHREFVTHTGYIGKKRFSVVSTGIGTDNIDIVLNELDALVNIDLETRTVKHQLQQLKIVRVGTSGSLQKDIPVDGLLVSTHGLGIDNLMNFYDTHTDDTQQQLIDAFVQQTGLSGKVSAPYINACDDSLLKYFENDLYSGITVTCPGFYGPQGRHLRLGLKNAGFVDSLTNFNHKGLKITNFEMETAGIYGLSKALGHQAVSLNAIVANRVSGQFSANAHATMQGLISKVLDILSVVE